MTRTRTASLLVIMATPALIVLSAGCAPPNSPDPVPGPPGGPTHATYVPTVPPAGPQGEPFLPAFYDWVAHPENFPQDHCAQAKDLSDLFACDLP